MKNEYSISTLLAASILFAFSFSALAQVPDTLNIEEILITAKRSDDIIKSNINGQLIELENPIETGAIFKNQVGFGVEKRGNYGMEPVLRGFKYDQLNVQFDGGVHTANACPNRMDPAISQISPSEIEKIEVIKGPYDVRFGSSFGGIINIISKRPKRGSESIISGSVDAGYQSNGGNFYSNIFAQAIMKKVDFSINAGYKDYGNYESGDGQEIASSYTNWGYAIKMGINPKENQRIQISWRQSSAQDVMYAGLPMDGDFDKSSIGSVDYALTKLSPTIFSLKFKAYGSYVDHEMSNTRRPAYKLTHAVSPVNATVYGGRSEIGLNTSEKNILYAGVDYKHIGKQGVRNREVFINPCPPGQTFDPPKAFIDKTWQDSQHNDLGLFLENKYEITESLTWLVGVRTDFVNYAIDDPDTSFISQYNSDITPDSRVNFNLTTSLTWHLGNGLNFQWAAARATRAPSLTESFINHLSIGMDAYEYLGNPNLESEINYQTDIRVEKNWEFVSAYADVYYSYLQNYITAKLDTNIAKKYMKCKDPKGTKQFTNVDKAYMMGFEVGMDIRFLKHFDYSLGAAYTYAQNVTWDEPFSEITPFTVNTALTYNTKKINARLNGRIVAEQDRVSTTFNESTTPRFSVFDFYITYSPWKMLDINFAVTNIFDKNYVEHLSRAYKAMDTQSLYWEPGRSFNIGLKLKL